MTVEATQYNAGYRVKPGMTVEATQYNAGYRVKPGMTMEATQYNAGYRVKPGMATGGMRRNGGEGRRWNHDRARLASPLVGMAGQGDAFCQVLYCHLQGIGKR